MAHVLPMTALQVRDPVELLILVKSDDLPMQNASFRGCLESPERRPIPPGDKSPGYEQRPLKGA